MSLRPQTSRKVIKALYDLGFEIVRKHGSHVVMKHADGRITVIPVHARENIGVGLGYSPCLSVLSIDPTVTSAPFSHAPFTLTKVSI
jgi:predicted RNA binding protein YcfA (HicA-like mRNA interferase family)